MVLPFLREEGVADPELPAVPAALAEVRARTAELADASATVETLAQLG